MKTKSVFSINAFIPLFLFCCSCFVFTMLFISLSYLTNAGMMVYITDISLLLLIVLIGWFIVNEFRFKLLVILIKDDGMEVTNFMGWGRRKIIPFAVPDGIMMRGKAPADIEHVNVLYLVKGSERLVRISELYHSNYAALRESLRFRYMEIGSVEFSIYI